MTALAAPRVKTESKGTNQVLLAYKVKGSTKIYANSLVMLVAGYAQPASAVTGNRGVVGVAAETVDNSSGSDGDLEVPVQRGVFKFTAAGTLTQADIGKVAYASDDQTFSVSQATDEPIAGIVVRRESATEGWIDIDGKAPVMQALVDAIAEAVAP